MQNSIGLYIHIPFCKSKCPYCDFYSKKANDIDYDVYVNELINKIKFWSNKIDNPVSSIYFGGGTPSIIGAKRLSYILNKIKENFNIEPNAEITVEVNPDSGKLLDFDLLNYSGFNRISIGMQSAISEELHALGRIHNIIDVETTIKKAQLSGINNISLDLMIGIPKQSIDSLKSSIKFCFDCGVTHISSYILKIEKNTPFYKIKDKLELADDDLQADLYLAAVNYLDKLGYKQYEISNFAGAGYESIHNINYWNCGEYIGIGPSAHSFYNNERFYYNRNMSDFINNKIIFDCIGGSSQEYIMLSLRLNRGLIFEDYKRKFGIEIDEAFIKKAKYFVEAGYMELDSQRLCFTPKGFLVSNSILSDLM